MSVCAAFLCKRTLPYNQSAPPVTSHHPPGQAVALSVVVAEVSHFAVLDVQPCLPHVVPSHVSLVSVMTSEIALMYDRPPEWLFISC